MPFMTIFRPNVFICSSDKKPDSILVNIILSFDPIFPVLKLVEFIKNYETSCRRPPCSQYPLAIVTVVPIKIKDFFLFQKGFGKSCFPHLTRPGNENRFFFKIITDRFSQISRNYHVKDFAIKQSKAQIFLFLSKLFMKKGHPLKGPALDVAPHCLAPRRLLFTINYFVGNNLQRFMCRARGFLSRDDRIQSGRALPLSGAAHLPRRHS